MSITKTICGIHKLAAEIRDRDDQDLDLKGTIYDLHSSCYGKAPERKTPERIPVFMADEELEYGIRAREFGLENKRVEV